MSECARACARARVCVCVCVCVRARPRTRVCTYTSRCSVAHIALQISTKQRITDRQQITLLNKQMKKAICSMLSSPTPPPPFPTTHSHILSVLQSHPLSPASRRKRRTENNSKDMHMNKHIEEPRTEMLKRFTQRLSH